MSISFRRIDRKLFRGAITFVIRRVGSQGIIEHFVSFPEDSRGRELDGVNWEKFKAWIVHDEKVAREMFAKVRERSKSTVMLVEIVTKPNGIYEIRHGEIPI